MTAIRAPRAQRGFTLLEVMIAFVILAVALGLLLGMLSRGLHQVTQAQSESEAAMYAQSLLDAVGTLEPIEPGVRAGQFQGGRYRWRLQVEPAADPAPPPLPPDGTPLPQPATAPGAPLLYRLALQVEWGAAQPAQRLQLVTLRLRAPPGGAAPGADAAAAEPPPATGDPVK
jgi:general secretion pathway protein I